MADLIQSTTSRRMNVEKESTPPPLPQILPESGRAQPMIKLAHNLDESYQMVKERQKRYYELSAAANAANTQQQSAKRNKLRNRNFNNENINTTNANKKDLDEDDDSLEEGGPWQEVTNKLKRKKKLSASLTSVSDSVNQEKRTRIEGMQLNCRGKLHSTEATSTMMMTSKAAKLHTRMQPQPQQANLMPNVITPVMPTAGAATPPPRLKRKLQENVITIQKLNALSEQLRLEINELKSNLSTERSAVRVLRAQNEAETRKYKNEVKKLQNIVELMKKNGSQAAVAMKKSTELPVDAGNAANLTNYEIQRLTNELQTLKDAYKALEEKKVINGDADRRKAADIREMKDSYEIRLTQLSKSAKIEISRLLEELKSKERNIGQLKKELQILQTKTQKRSQNEQKINQIQQQKSRNATTSSAPTLMAKQTTTINKNKPKRNTKRNTIINNDEEKSKKIHLNDEIDNNFKNEANDEEQKIHKDLKDKELKNDNDEKDMTSSSAEATNEMKNLKELELYNNTKNLQNTVTINLVKPTVKVNSNNCRIQSSKLKSLVNIFENETQKTQNSIKNENVKRNFTTTNTRTTPIATTTATTKKCEEENEENQENEVQNHEEVTVEEQQQQNQAPDKKEFELLPHELTERLIDTTNTTINTSLTHQTNNNDNNNNNNNNTNNNHIDEIQTHTLHEFRTKDHNSDSDSALSSAPPSISPQPPPADMQTNDIWQTIRSYTRDIEKLQKDVDSMQKENERLRNELEVAKDQIIENEKTALEATTNNKKLKSFIERIQFLEQQERELTSECDDLREQNELLEFRILELEDSTDKWSLPCQNAPSTANNAATSSTATAAQSQNIWNFDTASSMEASFAHLENTTANISHQLNKMLEELSLKQEHKQCLQNVLELLEKQQERNLLMSQHCVGTSSSSNNSSGPNSFTTNSSSDETSSLEMAKSRISDYSSASSASTASCSTQPIFETLSNSLKSIKSPATINSRIVATVPPYNSTQPLHIAPNNTPNESPRKLRNCNASSTPNSSSSNSSNISTSWQSNSLTESGVFVESDFYSDNACTQTDFEEEAEEATAPTNNRIERQHHQQQQQRVPACTQHLSAIVAQQQHIATSPIGDQKRIQYYQDRLRLLESKLLVYESSGDLQTKRLADRLQREVQLEKELNELRDRVDYLESENAALEEEKCEFEEAENDTRLRLQRLEIDLEILSQRNVELELSKEALSAKYKDCSSECLILRDDLSAIETQLRNLDDDKRKAKENLEFLHNLLPVLIAYNLAIGTNYAADSELSAKSVTDQQVSASSYGMGNLNEGMPATSHNMNLSAFDGGNINAARLVGGECCCRELEEEICCLKNQLRQCNERYQEAMESADTHWAQMENEYKEREEMMRAKEACLKQKICQLEQILRADSSAANEKIMQMEETENDLKSLIKRLQCEQKRILDEHQALTREYECCRSENQRLCEAMKPLNESLEEERKCNQMLKSENSNLQKTQQDAEKRACVELKTLKAENSALRNEFQNSEITNCELREEVRTLESQIGKCHCQIESLQKKICELKDELGTKEDYCQRLEHQLEQKEGYCLAEEMDCNRQQNSRKTDCNRDDVTDLKSAAKGLCAALRNVRDCEAPQLNCVARDVKRLADCILGEKLCDDDGNEKPQKSTPKLIVTEITHI